MDLINIQITKNFDISATFLQCTYKWAYIIFIVPSKSNLYLRH
jgi:hypothetical protein